MEEMHDDKSSASKKENDYVKFYKYYYEKLKTEHPSWSPSQLTTIISLQWKKKKMFEKNPSSK
jgi:hypothetical protein